MRKRLATILLAILTTVGLVVAASPAGAAPAGQTFGDNKKIAVSGLVDGSNATGTFRPERAVQKGNGIDLVGRLQLKSAKGNVNQKDVAIPVALPTPAATPSAAPAAAPAAAAAPVCQVLNLTLGPLHLNLLGLIIDLNQVVLNLTANPFGGLLGSLLCSLAGGVPAGALQGLLTQITGLLNQILAGL